jgi:hypothetical protein
MTDLTVWRSDPLGHSRRLGPRGEWKPLVKRGHKTFLLKRKGYCLKRHGVGARDYLEWEEYP